jgi:tRNA-specific 2-thiouridylase
MQFLKLGRHFRLPGGAKVVVGRNDIENTHLRALLQPGEKAVEAANVTGPLAVLQSPKSEDDKRLAARICARYGDARSQARVVVRCGDETFEVEPATDEELAKLRI